MQIREEGEGKRKKKIQPYFVVKYDFSSAEKAKKRENLTTKVFKT